MPNDEPETPEPEQGPQPSDGQLEVDDDRGSRQTRERNRRLMIAAMKGLREVLPGDSRFGDTLSAGGEAQSQAMARRIAELSEERPSLLREAGLSALQVWDALTEGPARRGEKELVIAFTDLVDFSNWAMRAGDEAALELLRGVGDAIEPPVSANGGEVVKRLGDGMMAAFDEPQEAFDAVVEARERLAAVEAPGYQPKIRAGMHLGCPQRIGGDYLGVDVNIAARITEGAKGDELLVSESTLARLDTEDMRVRRKRFFRGKGVPQDVAIYSVRPR
jgi:adenylate cyclase